MTANSLVDIFQAYLPSIATEPTTTETVPATLRRLISSRLRRKTIAIK